MSFTPQRNALLVESSLAKLTSADFIVQSVKSTCTATSWLAITSAMPFEDTCSSNSGHSTSSPRTVMDIIHGCRTTAALGLAPEGMVDRRGSNERQQMRGRMEVKQKDQQ